MIAQPRRVRPPDESLELFQVLAIESVGRAEIHRDPMLHDAVLLENLVEHFERSAAIDHEIFRDDLEPIDDRFFFEDMPVMRHAQANPDAVVVEIVKRICRHDKSSGRKKQRIGLWFSHQLASKRERNLPYFAGLSAGWLPSVAQPPLPLQEFLPLQPLSPVLQPPLPLQEFCPLQE